MVVCIDDYKPGPKSIYKDADIEMEKPIEIEVANFIKKNYERSGCTNVEIVWNANQKDHKKDFIIRAVSPSGMQLSKKYEVKDMICTAATGYTGIEFSVGKYITGIQTSDADFWLIIVHNNIGIGKENWKTDDEFECQRYLIIVPKSSLYDAILADWELPKNSRRWKERKGGDFGLSRILCIPYTDLLELTPYKAVTYLAPCTLEPDRHKSNRESPIID